MLIRWWEHSQKDVTDGQTDWTIHRAAWSQLKNKIASHEQISYNLEHQLLLCQMPHTSINVTILKPTWGIEKCNHRIAEHITLK